MNNTEQSKTRKSIGFAAIDQWVETNIISPKENLVASKDLVEWGDRNQYPEYLLDLYNNVTTLRSVINGNIDFITGDNITIQPLTAAFSNGRMNAKGDTITEQVRDIAKDYELYGGFALQIIRDFTGAVAEVHYMDMRYLRTNAECKVFYYSEKWDKARKDIVIYPVFMPNLDWNKLSDEERTRNASSVLYVKNVHTQVYPAPLFAAAVKACEIERLCDDFHLSAINHQFVSSAIINFNNGIPEDDIKEEIERECNEKFSGANNAARIMYSWNPGKENATEIMEFKVEDFGERYKSLAQHSRQQIFAAFRAIPLLFGLTSEANTGFSTDEFEQSFKLYNRTQIRPVQRIIADAYDKIYGQKGVLNIVPFSLDGETETKVN